MEEVLSYTLHLKGILDLKKVKNLWFICLLAVPIYILFTAELYRYRTIDVFSCFHRFRVTKKTQIVSSPVLSKLRTRVLFCSCTRAHRHNRRNTFRSRLFSLNHLLKVKRDLFSVAFYTHKTCAEFCRSSSVEYFRHLFYLYTLASA